MDSLVRKIKGPYVIWAILAICIICVSNHPQCHLHLVFLFSHLGELSAIRLGHLPLINTATVLVGLERNNCIAHETHLSFHKLSGECRGVFPNGHTQAKKQVPGVMVSSVGPSYIKAFFANATHNLPIRGFSL